MSWKDKTIALGELADIMREERGPNTDSGIDMVMLRVSSAKLGGDDDEVAEFYDQATGTPADE